MRSTPSLRFRCLSRRIARYGLGGIVNSIITYLTFVLLLGPLDYRAAYTTAFSLGIVISYLVNARAVFRARTRWGTFGFYALLYIGQYLAGLGLVTTLVEIAAMQPAVASLVALAVLVPANFLWVRKLLTRSS